jgi:hypothetical protein
VQVVLDGARTDEELRADLGIRVPLACKLGDLRVLDSQVGACVRRPLSRFLAGCQQLARI